MQFLCMLYHYLLYIFSHYILINYVVLIPFAGLRKTPTEGTSPIGPGPTSGQLALKTYKNRAQVKKLCIYMNVYVNVFFLKVLNVSIFFIQLNYYYDLIHISKRIFLYRVYFFVTFDKSLYLLKYYC